LNYTRFPTGIKISFLAFLAVHSFAVGVFAAQRPAHQPRRTRATSEGTPRQSRRRVGCTRCWVARCPA